MYKRVAILFLTTVATSLSMVAPVPHFLANFPSLNAIALADTPDKAPAALVNAIAALDAAASKRDLDAVMNYYEASFKNSDGLTKDKLRSSLETLWQKYSNLQYRTELVKWERIGDGYKAETLTQIEGSRGDGAAKFRLDAKLASTQTYQQRGSSWQISSQEILSEGSLLTSGEKPPAVDLRIPSKIGVGREYALDAIVTEPLGNSLLLGTVLEESVSADNYLKEFTVDLEALRSGGVFKIGKAPYSEGDRWISVVLIRENGISITGQRLQVSKDFVGEQYRSLPEVLTPSRVRSNPNSPPTL